jgi:hypothetical protein
MTGREERRGEERRGEERRGEKSRLIFWKQQKLVVVRLDWVPVLSSSMWLSGAMSGSPGSIGCRKEM